MASVLPETASDGKALTDAWDYKGRPASRATTGGWGCAAMILGTYHFASTDTAHDLCRARSLFVPPMHVWD
ncbi:protein NRT1/ PTR FAMILY 6.3-like [Panicum miliaceum]|uniref:Protein NRT1/ PTR FAMILY 6.3-like n=1 Tax=Panicum miliaceum TaxID=4540 RepID=A0A3L6TNQ0_PANMI|nr:protein NRT1/ PTR FAMILY 6.3-like [Panicum miliaceum]